MRRALWIAADLSREAITRPGLIALSIGMIVLVPLQMGLSIGALSRLVIPQGWGRDFLTASAFCPAMSAVFLFGGLIVPRLLTHQMEPLLASPASDREIAIGCVLPFLALAVAGSIPASAFTLAGYALAAGGPPAGVAARCLDLVLAMQAANLWIGCALIRSIRRLGSPAFTAWNILLACLGWAVLDAATGVWLGPGTPRRLLVWTAALVASVPASWWVSRRVDRETLIAAR